jgi:hypothetical protein
MTDNNRLGRWVRRFLLEYLINERNLSRGTQRSYRDTLALLIPFVARQTRTGVDALNVVHVSAEAVRMFLAYLEDSRNSVVRPGTSGWQPSTRWPVLWPCAAQSISLGAEKSVRYLSKNAPRSRSRIWRRPKSMHYSRPPTSGVRKDDAITFFSFSSTTQAPAPTKPPRSLLAIFTLRMCPAETFRG